METMPVAKPGQKFRHKACNEVYTVTGVEGNTVFLAREEDPEPIMIRMDILDLFGFEPIYC